jgi:hypothetical protein
MGSSWSHDLDRGFSRLTKLAWVNLIYCHLDMFLRKMCMKFFLSQIIFLVVVRIVFGLTRFTEVISGQPPHNLDLFILESKLSMTEYFFILKKLI